MKIDVASDLHVDAWQRNAHMLDSSVRLWAGEPHKSTYLYLDWEVYKNQDSKVLVLAGDISNNLMITKEVISAASQVYEHVVVVEGNHDHYDTKMSVEDAMEMFSGLLSHMPNVHYLKFNETFELDGVLFCGATGWYDFKAYEDKGITEILAKKVWKEYSNDAVYPTFKAGSPNSLAASQAVNLATQVKLGSENPDIHSIVVTTHMSPRADLMEWKSDNPVWNALTPSYVNTGLKSVVDSDTNKKIRYWVYGHTHARKMTEVDGIVYVNNARGYPRENPPFTLTQLEISSK